MALTHAISIPFLGGINKITITKGVIIFLVIPSDYPILLLLNN